MTKGTTAELKKNNENKCKEIANRELLHPQNIGWVMVIGEH